MISNRVVRLSSLTPPERAKKSRKSSIQLFNACDWRNVDVPNEMLAFRDYSVQQSSFRSFSLPCVGSKRILSRSATTGTVTEFPTSADASRNVVPSENEKVHATAATPSAPAASRVQTSFPPSPPSTATAPTRQRQAQATCFPYPFVTVIVVVDAGEHTSNDTFWNFKRVEGGSCREERRAVKLVAVTLGGVSRNSASGRTGRVGESGNVFSSPRFGRDASRK